MNQVQNINQNEIANVIVHDPRGDFSVYEPSPIKTRVAAFLLDLFLLGVLTEVVTVFIETYTPYVLSLVFIIPLTILSAFAVSIIYSVYSMRVFGATPGKRLFDLQVVNMDNSEQLSYSKIMMREFTFKVLSCFFMLGYILPFLRSDKRAGHDLMANTRVIKIK